MESGDAPVEREEDGVMRRSLFDPAQGCSEFQQRLLHFRERSEKRSDDHQDEVLYVLSGGGSLTVGGEQHNLAPGTAAYVARGTEWRVEEADDLLVLSVLVPDPSPPNGTAHAVLDLAAEETKGATAGRQFRLLATPAVGCRSVTQFVGYIPVGRAPDHFHKYDEVVYVLEGKGALHMAGESVELGAGSCIHFPARMVHSLENSGPGVMQVLGVFRPAGSPAEAYYPDGTPAAMPEAS
jgi:mannose-6-phosphate isomerase-like protein (cupin superfamily)